MSERGEKLCFLAKILVWVLLFFLCFCKMALPKQSLTLQVYTIDRCLTSIHSFVISEIACFFIMDALPNFKEISAHLAGFLVMLLCLVWKALLTLLLSIQDCQFIFSISFYFLLSSSDMYLVSFIFCSPLPSLQRYACWTSLKLFCSWPYLSSYRITNTRERQHYKYWQQCASYLVIRMKEEMSNDGMNTSFKSKETAMYFRSFRSKEQPRNVFYRNVTCKKRSLWMCLLCRSTTPQSTEWHRWWPSVP